MNYSIIELALLVIAGLVAGSYAKSEGASNLLAAAIGLVTAVLIAVLGT